VRPTEILFRGAGCVAPLDKEGAPIPRNLSVTATRCAMCGGADPGWLYGDLFSENFFTLSSQGKLLGYAQDGHADAFCAACTWAAQSLALRCAPWVATPVGVWFVPRRLLLAALLDPPEPPFVFGAPLYGADHGGETHAWRCAWPGAPPLPAGYYWPLPEGEPGAKVVTPLARLQAKHCAVYAQTGHHRDRYPLQVDDALCVMVDRPLWTDLAARLGEVASLLRAASVGIDDCRTSMLRVRCPARAPATIHARWATLTRGLDRYARSAWWPLLTDLVPLPDAPPKPERAVRARPAAPPKPAPPAPTTPAQRSLF
jgi:hypothetical protein